MYQRKTDHDSHSQNDGTFTTKGCIKGKPNDLHSQKDYKFSLEVMCERKMDHDPYSQNNDTFTTEMCSKGK